MSEAIKGSCLCGGVKFTINGAPGPIGQCHCSKCRKVSGTDGNAVMHAALANFAWDSGEELIQKFHPDLNDKWHSIFCRTCGSPLPLKGEASDLYFIPAGLLDDDPGHRGYIGHIFVDSKAPWVEITDDKVQFSENVSSERRDKK